MMKTGLHRLVGVIALMLVISSCTTRYVPKPHGYFRIDLPEQTYRATSIGSCPVVVELPEAAEVQQRGEEDWYDLSYPALGARIHCSYKPVSGNLRELSDDAQEFVFKHAGIASSIPEQGYEDSERKVYGVFYELRGNTASPCQFYLTDSVHHFFRGALYFDCIPNQDSLAPVVAYLIEDVRHMIETLTWQ